MNKVIVIINQGVAEIAYASSMVQVLVLDCDELDEMGAGDTDLDRLTRLAFDGEINEAMEFRNLLHDGHTDRYEVDD